ncbi:phage tail protein I [Spartinivicinus poritis]|uniref:Phage tail protein I n=1 Tax=Spartinivicinus poritis TaxID=2994640 RepID=A0ABT5UEI6_9GAMM|nr:phage tail protein I [Spartinivicinus sp. A2-2]MDE1464786.1 phage tail protein I [Spartinivicinus sp. A2-2]
MAGHNSLLPSNLTELERDLEAALADAKALIPIPLETIWHPYQCPTPLLPYLAWAVSVDHWQSSWPEQIKRQVIANSIEVHEIKGTRRALEKALAALDFDIEVKEWFEKKPPGKRGTFEIKANLSNRGIDEAEYQNARQVVDSAKNMRSHYDLTLYLTNQTPLPKMAISCQQGQQATVIPYLVKQINSQICSCLTSGYQSATAHLVYPTITTQLDSQLSRTIITGYQSVNTLTVYPKGA